ncbi:type II toxin-antitoxin system HicA family toxin [Candidatus Micrarchaeota archaeon]|nr:type II toxin-antitoxin system HicA family toxin [Candidatus Micrarchaeota archaeon]MBU2476302.1 type II toxin-antitoxin system HicA family toxin [Candidatus Micrarchaeota archaeon]
MPLQVTSKKLIKVLQKLGFEQTRIRGSHHRFAHPDGRKTSVPIHGNESIGSGILNSIIKKDLKMNKKEFLELLER